MVPAFPNRSRVLTAPPHRNAATGAQLNSIDTGSQVCALLWSPRAKELVSSHGFSQHQLCLWRYPSMAKVKELTGHTSRVLHRLFFGTIKSKIRCRSNSTTKPRHHTFCAPSGPVAGRLYGG